MFYIRYNYKFRDMLGAIIGDVVGSVYEWKQSKRKDFKLLSSDSRFTDDTVMTIAVADSLMNGKPYASTLRAWGLKYPKAGYGGNFRRWLAGLIEGPYNSWGNGSAMRVSPVAYACETLEEVLAEAKRSAEITHNHPEGIKGAQAIASCVFLARESRDKDYIRDYITDTFNYKLDRTLTEIRPNYRFEVSCQKSVPEAIIAFWESVDFEDAIRNAVSLGGDADTQACMAGAIAEAYYKEIDPILIREVRRILPEDMIEILDGFKENYEV